MNQTEPLLFTVPLSFTAHGLAQSQAQHQPAPRAKQTYLNALAVYAVDYYLRCLGIETDPTQADWRDPVISKFMSIADLRLAAGGKLECCVVLPGDQALEVSADAWEDRDGYMVVQLDTMLKMATLLGFTAQPVSQLPLTQLRSLAEFPSYLAQMQAASLAALSPAIVSPAIAPSETPSEAPSETLAETLAETLTSAEILAETSADHAMIPSDISGSGISGSVGNTKMAIRLRNWLEGTIEAGWQSLEAVLGDDRLPVPVRSGQPFAITVRQAKLLDTGIDLGGHAVVLSLAITVNPDTSMNVLVQLYPQPGTARLPANVRLVMLTETGEVVQQVWAREQDNYIQLKHFRGEAGDIFEIQVWLDDLCIAESFIL